MVSCFRIVAVKLEFPWLGNSLLGDKTILIRTKTGGSSNCLQFVTYYWLSLLSSGSWDIDSTSLYFRCFNQQIVFGSKKESYWKKTSIISLIIFNFVFVRELLFFADHLLHFKLNELSITLISGCFIVWFSLTRED